MLNPVRRVFHLAFVTLIIAIISRSQMAAQAAQTAPACNKVMASITQKLTENCSALDNDQLCYGNQTITVTYNDSVSKVNFAKAGDVIDLSAVKSFSTSPLRAETGDWGIALLKMRTTGVQNTTAGQSVTFVLYGDTTVSTVKGQNIVPNQPQAASCSGTLSRAAKLYVRPNSNEAVQTLPANMEVTVVSRYADGKWIFGQALGKSGWISVSNLTLKCKLDALPTDDPDKPVGLQGVTGFYFSTPISAQAACQDMPSGGMLIHSPAGRAVKFTLNGADLTLHSTAVLSAKPDKQMNVRVLTGHVEVTAKGKTQTVEKGEQLSLPLGELDPNTGEIEVAGPPSEPEPALTDLNAENALGDPCASADQSGSTPDWCATEQQSTGAEVPNSSSPDLNATDEAENSNSTDSEETPTNEPENNIESTPGPSEENGSAPDDSGSGSDDSGGSGSGSEG